MEGGFFSSQGGGEAVCLVFGKQGDGPLASLKWRAGDIKGKHPTPAAHECPHDTQLHQHDHPPASHSERGAGSMYHGPEYLAFGHVFDDRVVGGIDSRQHYYIRLGSVSDLPDTAFLALANDDGDLAILDWPLSDQYYICWVYVGRHGIIADFHVIVVADLVFWDFERCHIDGVLVYHLHVLQALLLNIPDQIEPPFR